MRYLGFVLLLLLLMPSFAWSWDGNWTNAASGRAWDLFDDPGRSQGQAGTDPPQNFWIPGPRDYADVDPEELHDYFDRKNRHYTPYALVRIEQNLHYGKLTVSKGYYLIKPGLDMNAGSINVNLKTLNTYGPVPPEAASSPTEATQSLPPLETEVEEETPAVLTSPATTSSASGPRVSAPQAQTGSKQEDTFKSDAPIYRTFVLIKSGKVVGVVPVHHMERYQRKKKEKLPKQAVAWLEWEERRPVLKFYYRKWVYETEFQ